MSQPTPDQYQPDEAAVLTTRQGHPVHDNQNQRTIGSRRPATLENYQYLEKMSHFDRERVPERVVHARGAAAFGLFEAYGTVGDEPISRYTRAKLFQEKVALMSRYGSPPHRHHQDEVARELTELVGPGFMRFAQTAGVDHRSPALPLSRYPKMTGFTEASNA